MALLCFTFITCGKPNSSENYQIISMWHFWSEPHQKDVLTAQILEFQRLNPTIKVELTELQWSDGKTKLMLGFNAQNPPDVVHLGFEWMPEFIRSGVLKPLSDSLLSDTSGYFSPTIKSLIVNHKLYGLPWTMNTRAMLVSPDNALSTLQGKLTWNNLREMKERSQKVNFWGINSTEPHNVLKKTLPIIWSAGSKLFTTLPLSKSFDSLSVVGLEFYLEMCKDGKLEQSRKLDDLFLQGKVATWITGQWILDKAQQLHKDSSFTVLSEIPVINNNTTGYSILGGDCLAIAKQSKSHNSAEILLQFLTKFKQSNEFCTKISDAGFPASNEVFTTKYVNSLNKKLRDFLLQIQHSRILPSSPYFLESERIMEEEIMNAVYNKKSAKEALKSAQKRIESVEFGVR